MSTVSCNSPSPTSPSFLLRPLAHPPDVFQSDEGGRASLRRAEAIGRDEPEMLRVGLEVISAKIRNQSPRQDIVTSEDLP